MGFLKVVLWLIGGLVALLVVIGLFSPRPKDTSGVGRCFSTWDGSHPELVRAVRDGLHDPASFQHASTVLAGRDGSERRAVVMTYRARNLMGGTVTWRASGMIFPPRCELHILSLQH